MAIEINIPEGLLPLTKNRLDVTWDDDATDSKYTVMIANGIAYLDGKLGASGDYLSPGTAQELLFEYVRYARDDALDVFETNYTHRLLAAQNERRVNAYVEGTLPTQC